MTDYIYHGIIHFKAIASGIFYYLCNMKRLFYAIFTITLALTACSDYSRQRALTRLADSITDTNPDSALRVLASAESLFANAPIHIRCRYQLVKAKAMNKAYVPFTEDSTMKAVTKYYDRHGSANERMQAHYLLGCAYRDMDSLPMALQCYEEAAMAADTAAADCDYATLSRIYGQSAELFSRLWMPHNVLKSCRLSYKYAMAAKDTLTALMSYGFSSEAYNLLNDTLNVIRISENAARLLGKYGYHKASAMSLGALVNTYSCIKDFKNARRCIERYEAESGYFDKDGNIEKGREIYYYNKAVFYLGVNKADSAYACLCKLQQAPKQTLNIRIATARGLSLLYDKLGNADSTAKYALLSYELDDSLCTHLMKSGCSIQQTQYEHNRLQSEISRKEQKAQHATITALAAALGLVLAVFTFILIIKRRHAEAERKQRQYAQDNERLTQAQTTLQALLAQTEEERNTLAEEYRKTIDELTSRKKQTDAATVEERLRNAPITKRFRQMGATPSQHPTKDDWHELRMMVNAEIPQFYSTLNSRHTLRPDEYDLCLLVRLGLKTLEMSNLMGCSQQNISAMRRRMMPKVLGREGSPKDFDEYVKNIIE